jgi:hypothetical protein
MKYNFYELKKRPKKQELPLDVNEPPEVIAKKLGGDKLLAALLKMKKLRLYGKVLHFNNKTNSVDGWFNFLSGMCTQYFFNELFDGGHPEKKLDIDKDGAIIIQRSLHNENLLMFRPRNDKEGNGDRYENDQQQTNA